MPQLTYVPRLISPQETRTAEGSKGVFKAHINVEEPYSYADMKILKDQPGLRKNAIKNAKLPYHLSRNFPTPISKVPGQKK